MKYRGKIKWMRGCMIPVLALLMIACDNSRSKQKDERMMADADTVYIAANDDRIRYVGRINDEDPENVHLIWTGTQVKLAFTGTEITLLLDDEGNGNDKYGAYSRNWYQVIIDDLEPITLPLDSGKLSYTIGSLPNRPHELTLFKRTEASVGYTIFRGVKLPPGEKLLEPPAEKALKMLFIGNSITAGYGNEGQSDTCRFSPATENGYLAFSAITARRLNAEYAAVAYSGKGLYRNYGGETEETVPYIFERVHPHYGNPKWDHSRYDPAIIVINLGTNDFNKGNPERKAFVNAYLRFLKRIREVHADAKIFLLVGPMMSDMYPAGRKVLSTAKEYVEAVVESRRAQGDEQIWMHVYAPQGKYGYGCSHHPNLKQHEVMAEELVGVIREKL